MGSCVAQRVRQPVGHEREVAVLRPEGQRLHPRGEGPGAQDCTPALATAVIPRPVHTAPSFAAWGKAEL